MVQQTSIIDLIPTHILAPSLKVALALPILLHPITGRHDSASTFKPKFRLSTHIFNLITLTFSLIQVSEPLASNDRVKWDLGDVVVPARSLSHPLRLHLRQVATHSAWTSMLRLARNILGELWIYHEFFINRVKTGEFDMLVIW